MNKIAIYSIIVVSAIAIGAGTGVVVKRFAGSEDVDYGSLNMNDMKPDYDAIVRKVESYRGGQEIVDVFSAADVIDYSMEKYRRCENSCSFVFGVAETIVHQDIRSAQIKNGNSYFEESVSKSSAVAVASRMYQEGVNTQITLHKDAKDINIGDPVTSADYSSSVKEDFTANDYAAKYGKTLDEVYIYLVSNETVIDSNVKKNVDSYEVTVDLDPTISTYFYKLQMKNISSLDKLPVFSSVKLTFTLTKDLKMKHLSVDEQYVATMLVDAKTHGTLEYYFYPDTYYKIPELEEPLTYKKGD